MRRVVWSEHAHDDFRAVIGYIAQTNPAAADTVARRIDQAVRALAAMPTGRKGRVSGTYEKLVHGLPYIIAYALGDEPGDRESVTILRVIHGARDWRADSWPDG